MADIQYWEARWAEDLQAVEKLVDEIRNDQSRKDRTAVLQQCKERLRDARHIKHTLRSQMSLISDSHKRACKQRFQRLQDKLKALQQEYDAVEAENARSALFSDCNGRDGIRAGDEMIQETLKVQDETQAVIRNIKDTIDATKVIGIDTLEELEQQRHTIEKIQSATDHVDDSLMQSEGLLKHFGKRMATDRFLQCFAVINCLLLVGVVLYVIITKSGLHESRDGSPINPDRLTIRRS